MEKWWQPWPPTYVARVYTIHGLILLLFLSFSLRSFSPGTLGFFILFFCFATLLWHYSNKLQESIRIWQESPKKPWGLSRPSTQNPTFLKFQFNQEWYVAVLILNLYFIYSLIYVCNMYVLKSKKWVNSQCRTCIMVTQYSHWLSHKLSKHQVPMQ